MTFGLSMTISQKFWWLCDSVIFPHEKSSSVHNNIMPNRHDFSQNRFYVVYETDTFGNESPKVESLKQANYVNCLLTFRVRNIRKSFKQKAREYDNACSYSRKARGCEFGSWLHIVTTIRGQKKNNWLICTGPEVEDEFFIWPDGQLSIPTKIPFQ